MTVGVCQDWSWRLLLTMHCLDVTHRNHLRDMIGIKWPRGHISNNKLYERCSTRTPQPQRESLRSQMEDAGSCFTLWWGYSCVASVEILYFTEESGSGFKGRRGSPRMNLLNVFRNDLKRHQIVNTLENLDDFEDLRGPLLWIKYFGRVYLIIF